jgi:multicomponent Na+:H+ antiporter subunit E
LKIKTRSRIIVFILSFLVWVALTNIRDIQEVIAGLFLSLIVCFVAGHFLITTAKSKNLFIRSITSIKYFFIFIWEMIKANIHVAYIVIHPKLPIRPGIVKIKTNLTKDSARTVLANSITLTPGTMTVDINPDKNEYYIHWIDIISKNPSDVKENSEKISNKFEKILAEVFE